MFRPLIVLIILGVSTNVATAQSNALVQRIVGYFPGEWEFKSEDGEIEGSVDWSAVANDTSISGPGQSEEMATHHLAGWTPDRKAWLHTVHREDGQMIQLAVQRFEGDTYYGSGRKVEANGDVVEYSWENKIVDKDHFITTQRTKDGKLSVHWHRKP